MLSSIWEGNLQFLLFAIFRKPDRYIKEVILEDIETIDVEACPNRFLKIYYTHYSILDFY